MLNIRGFMQKYLCNERVLLTTCSIIFFISFLITSQLITGEFRDLPYMILAFFIAGILIWSMLMTAVEWKISDKSSPCCKPTILYGINALAGFKTLILTIIGMIAWNIFRFTINPYILIISFYFLIKTVLIMFLFDGKTRRNLLLFNLAVFAAIGIVVAILLFHPL